MSTLTFPVWLGTDTDEIFILKIDDVAIDHGTITRAKILIDGAAYADSDVYPDAWVMNSAQRITARLGRGGDLPKGTYSARLCTYDTAHPNGFVWDTALLITVE